MTSVGLAVGDRVRVAAEEACSRRGTRVHKSIVMTVVAIADIFETHTVSCEWSLDSSTAQHGWFRERDLVFVSAAERLSVTRSALGIEVHVVGKPVLCLTDADAVALGRQLLAVVAVDPADKLDAEWRLAHADGVNRVFGGQAVAVPIVECKVCHVVLYDDAAKVGYCTHHEPAPGGTR